MSENQQKREFGHGSRETPDMSDKFLEGIGYYRKHTALDSSSLFRVVAEQHYGAQINHDKVRQACVDYMRCNKSQFAKECKWRYVNYHKYVNYVSKPRTYGTLLELKALACLYKANVFLFEPFSEGKWFVREDAHEKVWNVFAGRDNHFDSVYTIQHVKVMAECQAIVYEILYEKVLRLPDVQYAVERMLHDPDGSKTKYAKDDQDNDIAITEDGRQLQLSKPENTKCALTFSHLCHFHNPISFEMIARFFDKYGPEEGYRMYVGPNVRTAGRKPNPLLPDRNISCVRQLLDLKISPFPYKVAKALDNNIYRNTELDAWHETRMERWSASLAARAAHGQSLIRRQNTPQVVSFPLQFMPEAYHHGVPRLPFANPSVSGVLMAEDINTGTPEEGEASGVYQNTLGEGYDRNLALVPYSMPQYYVPSAPEQYGGMNAVMVANQMMYDESSGQTSSVRHPFYPTAGGPPTNFRAPPDFNQQQQHEPVSLPPNVDQYEFWMQYDFNKAQLAQQQRQIELQLQQQQLAHNNLPDGGGEANSYRHGVPRLQFANPSISEVLMAEGVNTATTEVGEGSGVYQNVLGEGYDRNLALVPYSMPQYYVPSAPEKYGGMNAVMVANQTHMMYGEGRVAGCALHPFYPTAGSPPTNFHAPPDFNQQQQHEPVSLPPNVDQYEFWMQYDFNKAQLAQQQRQIELQPQQQQLAYNNQHTVSIPTPYLPDGGDEANIAANMFANMFLSPPPSPHPPLDGVPYSPKK